MFLHSIRWRFAAWLAFLLVCILAGFGITAYQLHRTNRFTQIDEDLERRVSALVGDLRGRAPGGPLERHGPFARGPGWPPPGRPGPEALPPFGPPEPWSEPRQVQISSGTLRLFGADDPQEYYFAIWSRGGALLRSSTNAPTGVAVPVRLDKDTRIQVRMRDEYREAYYFTGMGECVLVGRPIAGDLIALRRFAGWLFIAGTAVLAVGLGGGWLLASRALRPVEDISTSAARISAGNLSERISVAATDNELGRLAAVLNSTFARLEASFAQQKQFTADAAHELRTPLAVLISEAQTTLTRERTAAEYRQAVEVCLETAQQMRRLSQALLELARFDAGQVAIERLPFDLAEQSRTCVELVRPLAGTKGLRFETDLKPAGIVGDADRFCQVVTNLLSNAVQFSPVAGAIRVSTWAENGSAFLRVEDAGPGIAPDDLPRVFERFYRGDAARGRANGHSGLGLAIGKAIVDAHGGSIEVSSQLGVGTSFVVRLAQDSVSAAAPAHSPPACPNPAGGQHR